MQAIKSLNLSPKPKKKSFFRTHKFLSVAAVIFAIVLLLVWTTSTSKTAFNYVFGNVSSLQMENGRVNVLLMGIGGTNHEGPNLTDTIIVASYNFDTKKADLISLPRDLWLEEYDAKINTLYTYGLQKGDALKYTAEAIEKVVGMTIPYAVVVDFKGFIKAVDLVGGLDVQVERSFDDYMYPIEGKENEMCGNKEEEQEIDEAKSKELNIPQGKQKVYITPEGKTATDSAKLEYNCRYEHISYKAGPTHMDGITALKFVRSRHALGPEGSDFARSKRQTLVIQAFRAQVLSLGTLTDLGKIKSLIDTFGQSIHTNIPQDKYLEFAKIARNQEGVQSYVIGTELKPPLLINPPSFKYGAWVLIPPNNDFRTIHNHVDNILSGKLEATPSATEKK